MHSSSGGVRIPSRSAKHTLIEVIPIYLRKLPLATREAATCDKCQTSLLTAEPFLSESILSR